MSPVIRSLQNPHVKNAAKLRSRRGRQQQGRIIIDGRRELTRALDARVELVEAFVCREYGQSDELDTLVGRLRHMNVAVQEVTPRILEKLSYGSRNDGIVAGDGFDSDIRRIAVDKAVIYDKAYHIGAGLIRNKTCLRSCWVGNHGGTCRRYGYKGPAISKQVAVGVGTCAAVQ